MRSRHLEPLGRKDPAPGPHAERQARGPSTLWSASAVKGRSSSILTAVASTATAQAGSSDGWRGALGSPNLSVRTRSATLSSGQRLTPEYRSVQPLRRPTQCAVLGPIAADDGAGASQEALGVSVLRGRAVVHTRRRVPVAGGELQGEPATHAIADYTDRSGAGVLLT